MKQSLAYADTSQLTWLYDANQIHITNKAKAY